MSSTKRLSIYLRLILAVVLVGVLSIASCAPMSYQTTPLPTFTTYKADYQISLNKVERPEKAGNRYGPQKVDAIATDQKYRFAFEDDMVKILWFVGSTNINFLLQNKTNYSVKIPWDEAAYVDEYGRSHRVMHSGVKYTDRDKPQPPSVIVRKGSIEDIVYPTDYVSWSSGTRYSSGSWTEKPLLLSMDFHGQYLKGKYSSLAEFEEAVNKNIGKQIQVLLP
ncbi:MAG: hypothetical protein Q8N82_07165, partial [Deltaproteobacteria bacterium]|nr:hypothetical protein [Deltaproteobacteria bacterium]